MKELDFDELDRAVNAIIDQRQAKQQAGVPYDDSADDDGDTAGDSTSGYVGATSPASYTVSGDDEDDGATVPSINDAPPMDGEYDDSDDVPPARPKRHPKRRFMDVKKPGSVRGMKIIQPLSSTELAEQGLGPVRSDASPQLDYAVTSKPFFDIKPGRQRRASDVTFLIDREESTSELVAGEASKSTSDGDQYDNETAPSSQPVVTELFDTDSMPATTVESETSESVPAAAEPSVSADDMVSVDDFTDTLESLEVKSLEAAPPPVEEPQPAPEVEPVVADESAVVSESIEELSPIADSSPPALQQEATALEEENAPIVDSISVHTDAPGATKIAVAEPTVEAGSLREFESPAESDLELVPQSESEFESESESESAEQAEESLSPVVEIHETSAATPSTDDQPALPPMQSPFLPDAKVEKRPLGSHVTAVDTSAQTEDTLPYKVKQPATIAPLDQASQDDQDTAEDVSPQSAPSSEPTAQPAQSTPVSADDTSVDIETLSDTPVDESSSTDTFNDDLPAEFQSSLLELEGDTTGQGFGDEAVETPAAAEDSPQKAPAAMISNQQIPRQYSEKKPAEVDTAPIYETETYRQPMTTAKKQKSGWWVIIIIVVVILLGGGGGALFFLMQTGSL